MRARSVMVRPASTVHPDDPVETATTHLAADPAAWLLVVDSAGRLVGTVGAADLVTRRDVAPRTVADVMSGDVAAVSPDTGLRETAKVMVDSRTGLVPVVDRGEPVGVVRCQDLLHQWLDTGTIARPTVPPRAGEQHAVRTWSGLGYPERD